MIYKDYINIMAINLFTKKGVIASTVEKLNTETADTNYNFSISCNPADATIMINNQERNNISVKYGDEVAFEASKHYYFTDSNKLKVFQDTVLNLTLSPDLPTYQECEWIKIIENDSYYFNYKKNFSTNNHYKIKVSCPVPYTPNVNTIYNVPWVYLNNTETECGCSYYMDFGHHGAASNKVRYSRASVHLNPVSKKEGVKIFNYEKDDYTIRLPNNSPFTIGFYAGQFYSDIGGTYSAKTTVNSGYGTMPSLPVNCTRKPHAYIKKDYKIYQYQEDNYTYKFFYVAKEDKFVVKEITTDDIVLDNIPMSNIDSYQLKQ